MTQTANRYLYAVQVLKDRYLCVRSVDLARYLGISKASVSAFIRQMRQQDLIEVEPDGNLLLTEQGLQQIHALGVRIEFFRQLLMDAGVCPDVALRDAISFSWRMSEDSFEVFRAMKPQQADHRD
jgi:DtxR family manganese transport transcriptional regulator